MTTSYVIYKAALYALEAILVVSIIWSIVSHIREDYKR